MAKDNLFLGYARGSVGDVTFSRIGGQQVARGRNRAPRNPQSPLQLVQRVCLKTASQAYSLTQEICNHSFQGKAEGTPSQSQFVMTNVAMLRQRAAAVIESDDAAAVYSSMLTNYASKECVLPEINDYAISNGTISSLYYAFVGFTGGNAAFSLVNNVMPEVSAESPLSYAKVIEALQLQRGDQLTFLFFSCDDTQDDSHFNGFRYSRVILDPAGGDLSVPFIDGIYVNDPNERNKGILRLSLSEDRHLLFSTPDFYLGPGRTNSLVGGAIIVSRLSGGIWQRSTQYVALRPWKTADAWALSHDHSTGFLGDAVTSFLSQVNSSLYLNQATV